MHDKERVEARAEIIHHNAGAFGKPLQSANWKWFQNVEDTKEYKAGEKRFPGKRDGDEGDELAGNFVDDDELGIFEADGAGDAAGGGDADESDDGRGDDGGPGLAAQGDAGDGQGPEDYGGDGGPCAGTGLDAADAEEGGDESRPERGPG